MRAWNQGERLHALVFAAAMFIAPALLALLGATIPTQAQTRGGLSV